MSRYVSSLPPEYFDERYAAAADPWHFETSAYERAKYDATLAALAKPRYAAGLEIGCSIGVLTERLAARCDTLLACDLAQAALDQAERRCGHLDHVTFRRAQIPQDWPEGTFDIILLSEVVYYLDGEDVGRLAACVRDTLRPGGEVLLVHWTGETHYPLSGDEAGELFIARSAGALSVGLQARTEAYRLDRLRRDC